MDHYLYHLSSLSALLQSFYQKTSSLCGVRYCFVTAHVSLLLLTIDGSRNQLNTFLWKWEGGKGVVEVFIL